MRPNLSTALTECEREALCERMHDAYEVAAVEQGWETQPRSRVPWRDVPEANKATMRAAVDAAVPPLLARRMAQAWEEGYAYRAGRGHPSTDPAKTRVGLDNPYRA